MVLEEADAPQRDDDSNGPYLEGNLGSFIVWVVERMVLTEADVLTDAVENR
jgi:hypothetical protein